MPTETEFQRKILEKLDNLEKMAKANLEMVKQLKILNENIERLNKNYS